MRPFGPRSIPDAQRVFHAVVLRRLVEGRAHCRLARGVFGFSTPKFCRCSTIELTLVGCGTRTRVSGLLAVTVGVEPTSQLLATLAFGRAGTSCILYLDDTTINWLRRVGVAPTEASL